MSKADSFVDNTSVVFIVLGILGVLLHSLGALLFVGWMDFFRSVNEGILRQMPTWVLVWVDHLAAIEVLKIGISAGLAMGAMGMVFRKVWAYRTFLLSLAFAIAGKGAALLFGIAALLFGRTPWEQSLGAQSPVFTFVSYLFSWLLSGLMLTVFIWLGVRFRRREIRELFL